jgi:hypothetical protein
MKPVRRDFLDGRVTAHEFPEEMKKAIEIVIKEEIRK